MFSKFRTKIFDHDQMPIGRYNQSGRGWRIQEKKKKPASILSRFSCVQHFATGRTARLFCPWDSPGKNTGVGCHVLLQGIFKKNSLINSKYGGFPGGTNGKKQQQQQQQQQKTHLPMQETQIQSLVWEDPLEEGMTIHSSILTWRIPWTEEPGGLQSIGFQRVG